ncbi:hypothetical protein [Kiritimatiella glycovorans]|uniref:Uncharacterized protein n=1 Tax=Kiritimatiella glycovorans TaxID=1307763 RepID=A0A0G3EFT1_9BACT|nr:hypothetical protein [Kiritimatiella glycovorans]AKJ64267.1 hypothetical protein L21SP4_01008 [Kiritimatiella glycovorans]
MKQADNGRTGLRAAVAALLLAATMPAASQELNLRRQPATLRGLPGEPLTAVLSAETEGDTSLRFEIPAVSNLLLRADEALPLTRSPEGRIRRARRLVWQAMEPGTRVLTNLVVRADGRRMHFPPLRIVVGDVDPADPPEAPEPETQE